MKLVKLNAPNGTFVWINPEMVCSVSPSTDGSNNARATVRHTTGVQYVRHTPEETVQLLEGK